MTVARLLPDGWLRVLLAWTCLMSGSPLPGSAQPAPGASEVAGLREAFVYAYPYYEFMWLRDQALNHSTSRTYTTLHRYRHQRHLATPEDRWANGPIRDALYSTAWLDLQSGPVLLSLPDTFDRYYVLVLIGADTNSFHLTGRRTGGTRARTVAVVGPDWRGDVPASDEVVRAPTRDVYVNLRVRVIDESDLPAAHQVQDGFAISPPAGVVASGPGVRPVSGDVGRMLDVINEALQRNPPVASEQPLLDRFRAWGVCPGCRFDTLPPATQGLWRTVAPAIVARLKTALDAGRIDMPRTRGWIGFRLPRSFGDRYPMRAGSAAMSGGIFGLEAAEATYFMAVTDQNDEALGQGRRYRLRLPAGGLPVDAFWSLSLYEFTEGGQYFVANAIGRYAIGDRTPGLVHNADGSLEVWIQPDEPADPRQRANWLPSPASARFYLNARLYQPRAPVLDSSWSMPAVERQGP